MDFEKRYIKQLDWLILLILLGLGLFSYLGISGSAPGVATANRQLMWYGIGFGVLFCTLIIDYRVFRQLSYIVYAGGLVLLFGVFFTKAINNATSWYNLGVVLFQPSEPMKIFTIIATAHYMSKREEKLGKPYYLYEWWPVFLIIGVPLLMIFKQPDLGTALVFCSILATMLIVGGIRVRHMISFSGIAAFAVGLVSYVYIYHKEDIFFKLIKPYQWARIESWLNPYHDPVGQGFQLLQSLIAIGSGQLTGKGLHTATQASLLWVPVGESDFIFTVIAERLGFIGAGIMMILFFVLVYRMIRIAMECNDPFGAYVVSGVVGMLTFQIFENIGMTIQLMPITGLPLPFISYGGSSLLTNFLTIGVVLNIGMRKQKLSFD
ncbi:rod shape-determining protein RodA [Brevibacillus laterosporus]|uniref:rod shape-determining protein RodA n=1 Tax=Brevibacillus laterosporus TaxID=1465 RepID=UPI00037B4D0E|nr:rod shape-determining protein RodA [Brevibacillus laterosporus]ATO50568.1 rod shape-determining protein RodA [Brevibacillus laterosporus DSM 25]AYB39237.1 rod shape-determining protein RodA [Brevibacillus laterosporus]MBG9775200.1 rod shape-determining protein RodA [Brevibacillus laterosporus]MBG9800330.1 rod shape-determining protein RodA [Brevibacillus laterosporus]MBG9801917.1 rod shape-determining protein RodA [Brevibacillus laterosporus]